MGNLNIPSVSVVTFSNIVREQFIEKNYRPIFGLGKGGIGKTESIHDLALELNVGYIDVRLLLYTETDLKGIPYPNAEHTKTVWLQNNILPTVEKDGESGILVFDEITSCAKSVRTAAYQLLNERKLGEYTLPDGWLIVCLGNGEEDGGDYQGMEGNFVNRCAVFNVVADVDTWKLWANTHGVHNLVTSYVSFRPQDLHSYDPESDTEMLFASPRSWNAVSNILNAKGYNENDLVTLNRIYANIGTSIGLRFASFCKFKDSTVDPNEIICNGAKPVINTQEILYITIGSVVNIVGDQIKNDMKTLNGGVQQDTLNKMANAIRWFVTLSKENAVMGIKDLISYDFNNIRRIMLIPEFLQVCPEISQFVAENKEIFR